MVNEGELKNRRILIKNAEDGTTIADTVILRFNSEANSVNRKNPHVFGIHLIPSPFPGQSGFP